jgi:hypothetical protein
MAENTTQTDDAALVCDTCGWQVSAPLFELALAVHCPGHSAEDFLAFAHCCACVQDRCACGGAVTVEDLAALLAALGDTPTPPRLVDWWDAVWAYDATHPAHRVGGVLCAARTA